MRTRAVLVALLFGGYAARAHAKPARLERIEVEDEPTPCMRGATWTEVSTCLAHTGRVTEVYATADVHVVHVQAAQGPEPRAGQVHGYVKKDAGWSRIPLFVNTGSNSTLLAVQPFETPNGRGIQVRVGVTMSMVFSLDATNPSVPGVLKREQTVVCVPSTWTCRAMITRCATYVGGKAYWSFDAEPFWHDTLGVRLRGDTRLALGTCMADASLVVEDGT